ncbi:hypothetical protein IFM89_034047 [Coptis chinensis]|uniref:SKP1-like protein n=1 Tax=Coptis chinensis TaxID=261450 RepID=A0A835IUC8_9MAGN|nr:hypothetical protein IFM89_034047 [Coptis chinensis]
MSASTSSIAPDEFESVNNLIDSFNPSITTTKKMVTLVSSDGKSFEVEEDVALESQAIKHWIEDRSNEDDDGKIHLPNVDSKNLEMIVKFCEKHVSCRKPKVGSSSGGDDELKEWDKEFLVMDIMDLGSLLLAANYLNIRCLLDAIYDNVVSMIKGKSVDEIRKTFRITSGFTPEEDEEIRSQNTWAFE